MPQLFSYGSLQRSDVQQSTFGRLLRGAADALPGFAIQLVPILDPVRAAFFERTHYTTAVAASDADSQVSGMVFELTDEELVATDVYEAQDTFVRIEATLASGLTAWVYVHAPAAPEHP